MITRRYRRLLIVPIFLLFLWYGPYRYVAHPRLPKERSAIDKLTHPGFFHRQFRWRDVRLRHPPASIIALPSGPTRHIPTVQYDFQPETADQRTLQDIRLEAVKEAFVHSWEGYKKSAWLQDEVTPLSGKFKNGFGGWGATLVDSLDTLWIMGLRKEFSMAVRELDKIDFKVNSMNFLNIFETNIRYLGGLLSAYDVSGREHKVLLRKAVELGDMIYLAFDTPNRMPVARWDWKNTALGGTQTADAHSLCAEIGSLSLELTRLSQLTGDSKYYDAIARVTNVMEEKQNSTRIPGLWPVFLDVFNNEFVDSTFTLGGMVDSAYEYLPKQHLLLGGRVDQYRNMYLYALESAKQDLFFRVLNPEDRKLLLAGTVKRFSSLSKKFDPQGQHLSCFMGGVVALGAKIFDQHDELDTARQLVDGCIWAYESMPSGIMPEIFTAIPCKADDVNCTWSDEKWYRGIAEHSNAHGDTFAELQESAQKVIEERRLAPGFAKIIDPRFLLRPEAIESVFVLYRITGDRSLREQAWRMFQAINNVTRTSIAYASLSDVTADKPELLDSMESFWTAETLKYFYLIFSKPDVISLDDYVLNTEAHPLLRPK